MINQQISFWDVSKTSLGYLSSQLEKMDQLSPEPSQLFRAFETAQKTYLNSCKKLVNISKDGLIEKCQNFIAERKYYQNEIAITAEVISNVFFEMPSQKCYFSIQLSHGLYTRLTFPYMPNLFNKYCKKTQNEQKHIYKTLLKYEQPQQFQVNIVDQKIILQNENFNITLEYYSGLFYFSGFTPVLPQINEQLDRFFRNNPDFMRKQCNKIGEIIKEIQKEEYFLTYILYFFNNTIKQIQSSLALFQQDASSKKQLSVEIHETIADFQNDCQTQIIYKHPLKQCYSETIIKSEEKYYLLLSQQSEMPEQLTINWNVEDSLEKKINDLFMLEKLKQECSKLMKSKNRNQPTYFPTHSQLDQFTNEDQEVDEIFQITKCSSFCKRPPFIFTFDKEMTSVGLWYESKDNISEIPLTYLDQNQIQQLFIDEQETYDYIRWIIVRNSALKISNKLAKTTITDSEIRFIQNNKNGEKRFVSVLTNLGFRYQNDFIPISDLLPSFEELDYSSITCVIENKLVNSKFLQIQQQYISL